MYNQSLRKPQMKRSCLSNPESHLCSGVTQIDRMFLHFIEYLLLTLPDILPPFPSLLSALGGGYAQITTIMTMGFHALSLLILSV